MAENNKSMDKGRKLLIGFIIVLLLLTAGAYFWSLLFYRAFSSRLTGEWF